MDNGPVIQHWLVTVVRSAGLPGAPELSFESDAGIAEAWDLTCMALGISVEELAGHVAKHFRLQVADLAVADPHAVRLVPRSVAERLGVVPLTYTDRTLMVATADPIRLDAEREIGAIAARTTFFQVAPPEAVIEAIAARYPAVTEEHRIPALMSDQLPSLHILVVDDDVDTRLLLRTALQGEGFRVSEAADGPEALEILAGREAIHLVTLDLLMEKMHGVEVLRRIRGRVKTAALPVVVATGSDDPETEMELFEAGADDFVVKPLDPRRFVLRVQAVLRRYGVNS